MLNNIKIHNYRNLKSLSIEKLGRVNLIIGRNNTGKTSLLEGLHILLLQGSNNVLNSILTSRHEQKEDSNSISDKIEELSNLFYGREISYLPGSGITISTSSTSNTYARNFSIRIIKFIEEEVSLKDFGITTINPSILPKGHIRKEALSNESEFKIGIEIFRNNEQNILSLNENDMFNATSSEVFFNSKVPDICKFIPSGCSVDKTSTGKWWANIVLTDGEDIVTEALKIIEPKIDRISQIKENSSSSRFLVKLKDQSRPVALRSMGDGINRILTTILAMVNCKNGYLLIDEFENGLHYSIQEKLWEIIFHLAEKLNIQVFATTHSNDTIRAFENVVNQNETVPLDGLLIKLENINDIIEATTFEPNELKVITDNLIEVRR